MAKKKVKASAARKAARGAGKSPKRKSAKRPRAAAAAKSKKPKQARVRRLKKTRMKKKQLDEFRQMLLEKRRTLVGDLTGMEETARQYSSGALSTMPTDMADIGTDNFEHEFTLGLLESEQAMLREIDEALQRIEDKTYGICLGTGKAIPMARLRAKPWAKHTVEYTRMLEKGLVRPAGLEEVESQEEEDQDTLRKKPVRKNAGTDQKRE